MSGPRGQAVVRLRISGTEAECAAAVRALEAGFVLREVSGFYPNRGASALGRVYVDAEPLGAALGEALGAQPASSSRGGAA
jgi:hypothetical protein